MRHNLDKEHLLKLTLAVYKVTALFPAGEELGVKIRELADNILCPDNGSRHIEEILGMFDLAEEKNWVDSRNFLVLRREYDKIRQVSEPSHSNGQNGHRHEKILEVMNGNGMVKIGELIKMFPEINRRTVLRDLDKLCQAGAVVRNGNGRGAYYIKNGLNHDTSQ